MNILQVAASVFRAALLVVLALTSSSLVSLLILLLMLVVLGLVLVAGVVILAAWSLLGGVFIVLLRLVSPFTFPFATAAAAPFTAFGAVMFTTSVTISAAFTVSFCLQC